MKVEKIYLDPEKLKFIQKIFNGKEKTSRFSLLAEISEVGRMNFNKAEEKLRIMEKEGYIVPICEWELEGEDIDNCMRMAK